MRTIPSLRSLSSADPLFAQAWRILTESFPDDERRSLESHKALERDHRYEFCAIMTAGACLGCVGVWRFDGFTLIEHLAVASVERSKGVGSAVIAELLTNAALPVVIEVEPASCGDEARRRITLYARLGFRANAYEYVQPPYDAQKRPVPMMVMTYPETLNRERLDIVKEIIYAEVYKVAPSHM